MVNEIELGKILVRGFAEEKAALPSSTSTIVGTALADSESGHVEIIVAGQPIEVETTTVIRPDDEVLLTLVGGRPIVTGVIARGDEEAQRVTETQEAAHEASESAAVAEEKADEALESVQEVSNHFWHDEDGAHVTTTPNDATVGANVVITSEGLDIKDGTSTLASFGDDEILLGAYDDTSRIILCDGRGEFSVATNDYGYKGLFLDSVGYAALTGGRSPGNLEKPTNISGKAWLEVLSQDTMQYGRDAEATIRTSIQSNDDQPARLIKASASLGSFSGKPGPDTPAKARSLFEVRASDMTWMDDTTGAMGSFSPKPYAATIGIGYGYPAYFYRVNQLVFVNSYNNNQAFPAVGNWQSLIEVLPVGLRPTGLSPHWNNAAYIHGVNGPNSIVWIVYSDGTMEYYNWGTPTNSGIAVSGFWFTADPWPA